MRRVPVVAVCVWLAGCGPPVTLRYTPTVGGDLGPAPMGEVARAPGCSTRAVVYEEGRPHVPHRYGFAGIQNELAVKGVKIVLPNEPHDLELYFTRRGEKKGDDNDIFVTYLTLGFYPTTTHGTYRLNVEVRKPGAPTKEFSYEGKTLRVEGWKALFMKGNVPTRGDPDDPGWFSHRTMEKEFARDLASSDYVACRR